MPRWSGDAAGHWELAEEFPPLQPKVWTDEGWQGKRFLRWALKNLQTKTVGQKKHGYLEIGCPQRLIETGLSPGHIPLRVPELRVFLLGASGALPLTTGSLFGGWDPFWTAGPGLEKGGPAVVGIPSCTLPHL